MKLTIFLISTLFLSSFMVSFIKHDNSPPVPITITNSYFDTTTLPTPTSPATLNGQASFDPDGSIVTWKWEQIGTTPLLCTFGTPNAVTTTVVPASGLAWAIGTYTFQLTITDNQGATATSQTHITISPNPHLPPGVSGGGNKIVQAPITTVTLTGTVTTTDGATVTAYQWSHISGPNVPTFVTPTTISTVVNGLIPGTYKVRFKVTDSKLASAADTITITVKTANVVPAANAGPDQQVLLPVKSVVVGGFDKPRNAKIQWTYVAGPSSYAIVSPTHSFTQIAGLVEGDYMFQKTVTTKDGGFAYDQVDIHVKAGKTTVEKHKKN